MSAGLSRDSVIIRFLDHYRDYGCYGHLWAAQALQESIARSRNREQQKLLAVKVYAEYVSAMEDLGALCIAVRHRNDDLGLIHAYLTYGQPRKRNAYAPSTQVREMFELMRSDGEPTSVLGLPQLREILDGDPALRDSLLPRLFRETNEVLASVSAAYLSDDHAYVRAYNKTKHGFVVVDDPRVFGDVQPGVEEKTTWIVADNPDLWEEAAPSSTAPIELFAVSLDDVDPMVGRIGMIRGAVEVLCELTIYLLKHREITATFHS